MKIKKLIGKGYEKSSPDHDVLEPQGAYVNEDTEIGKRVSAEGRAFKQYKFPWIQKAPNVKIRSCCWRYKQ